MLMELAHSLYMFIFVDLHKLTDINDNCVYSHVQNCSFNDFIYLFSYVFMMHRIAKGQEPRVGAVRSTWGKSRCDEVALAGCCRI